MRETLLEMLTFCRPMGSRTEQAFRERYLLNLPGAYEDPYGNIHVSVGESRCLWSCHTDTVHRYGGRQKISLSREGIATLHRRSKSNCLGADDTVGVYLMREMVRAKVPGMYVFHYGEERGGVGSNSVARYHSAYLTQSFDCAIALDRQGTGDIVTHQAGERCCSDLFAWSLSDALSLGDASLDYRPAHGVYTDTAEYMAAIPECTNLSVGYAGQHMSLESVDVRHVDRLLGALLTLDPGTLSIVRDPRDTDEEDPFERYWSGDVDPRYATRDELDLLADLQAMDDDDLDALDLDALHDELQRDVPLWRVVRPNKPKGD